MRSQYVCSVLLIVGAACASERPGSGPRALAADSGTVTVGSVTLQYVVQGRGEPCIVFGSRIFYPRTFSADFKRHLRCAYLDHRGFTAGVPVDSAQPYGVPAMVADLEAARQALGLDHFILVGHSIHGNTVLEYARLYPQYVTQVIAIGPAPAFTMEFVAQGPRYWEATASPGRKAQHARNQARVPPDSLRRLPLREAYLADRVAAAAEYFADSAYDSAWLYEGLELNFPVLGQMFDPARPFVFGGAPGSVTVPAFVALGRLDFVVPHVLWNEYRGPFADMTVHVFERAGHTPMLEDSAAFDREVLAWLRRGSR